MAALLGPACCLVWTLSLAVSPGRADDLPPLLKENVATQGVLDLGGQEMVSFRVEVPKDAVLLTVKVTQSPLPLDVLARLGEPLASADDAEHRSSPDILDNSLRISRQSHPALETGTYFLSVDYLGALPAVVHKRPVKKIPFTIKATVVHAKIDGVLEAGKKVVSQSRAETGSVRSFVIDVPATAKTLRLDLDEVSGDLDILARYGEPLVANGEAGNTAISPLGRESLVIDGASPQPLRPGRWYVNVVHPVDFGCVDFALYASFSADPPPALLVIPPLPMATDPRQRAVQATVDVSSEYGGASGTLLTDDGLVLTNYHVVTEVAESAGEDCPVVIAATLAPQEPPRELFRGRVLKFDKNLDLALIRIACGFYRQPLPKGYRFPWIPLGNSAALDIGDTLSIVGFPSIGGTAGRVSVTLTQGVLSGFERTTTGSLMKTDANISPGSSGGAALDSRWRLIGVPTFENVNPDSVSRMSYIYPVSLVPPSWRALIEKRQGSTPR